MRKLLFCFLSFTILLSSCDFIVGRRIKGNGTIVTEQRNIRSAERIKLQGSYEVALVQGPAASLKIETD